MYIMTVEKVETGYTFTEKLERYPADGTDPTNFDMKKMKQNATQEEAEEAAKELISWFNLTTRPWESERRLISVKKL